MKPHRHAVTQGDMNAAARGLNMAAKSVKELQKIIAEFDHPNLFASQVIRAAARQMLRVKRRMGAR